MVIRLYETPTCPRCQALADFLQHHEIEFVEEPLDAGAATEYLCNAGRPALAAPILQVGEDWYGPEQLFDNGELVACFLRGILDLGGPNGIN